MKQPTKVFIVEDMAISRTYLEEMLFKNNYEIVGSSATAEKAWKEIQSIKVELILLDINLAGDRNGIWLAQKIRRYFNFPIIYLTAYGDQQTIKEVIETKPNGYLMKPYQEPNLIAAIEIALNNFDRDTSEIKSLNNLNPKDEFIFVKDRYNKVKLFLNAILFIKSEGNYIEINLEDKKHVVRSKLSVFKEQLPENIFYQTHQRFIINIDKVEVIGKDFFTIKEDKIPISQKYKTKLERVLSNL